MKKILIFTISVILIINSFNATKSAKADFELPFTDLPTEHSDYEAIKYLYDRNIIQGYSDNTFRPEQTVNRAEALKIILMSSNYHFSETDEQIQLVNAENATPEVSINSEISAFLDISAKDWYYPYIKKANEMDIIHGYPNGFFYPEKSINLSEALKIILLSFSAEITQTMVDNPYNDVAVETWYAPYFSVFQNYKLLETDTDNNIYPNRPVSRAMLSSLIYRYIKRDEIKIINEKKQEQIEYIYGKATFYGEGDGFDGNHTANGEVFDKNQFTGASRTLPFNTKIRVYNLETNDYVDVRINDRGPYDYRFILDLSAEAFKRLAPISRGYIPIKYEILK